MPIRTAPPEGEPATYAVALVGCSFHSNDRITWDHMLARQVPETGRTIDYLDWGGDWHYADKSYEDPALHRELFESEWFTVDGLRDVLHRTPLIADQMSDHDGGEGGNNHDSYHNPGVVACQLAMSQMVPTPSLDVPKCRFSVKLLGRVLFISLDTRSIYRSKMHDHNGPKKTLLGAPQLAALFTWLDWAYNRGYLVMIQSDMVWDCDHIGDKHDWWGNYSYERDAVAAKIRGQRVIICDYDFHALRIKNVSDWGGTPVIGSAGAVANTNVRGDAADYYDQCWPDPNDGVDSFTRHWHQVVISDDGENITVDVTGFDPRDEVNPVKTRATFVINAPLVTL